VDEELMFEDVGDVELAAALSALRAEEVPAPDGFAGRLAAGLTRELRWRRPVRRAVHDPRTRYAALSLGGAILGAAAVALLWRRNVRRQAVA
jgi:hypothetical protein